MTRNKIWYQRYQSRNISGRKSLWFFYLAFFLPQEVQAENVSFKVAETSALPVHAVENGAVKANIIAIVGGKGVNNSAGRSQNYLVTQKEIFAAQGLNFYLLPNQSEQERANYRLRDSQKRTDRIKALVEAIKHRNGKPVFLVGFSRGSVDAGRFAKTYPEDVNGIVLASGIYTNSSKKAQDYALESIIGTRISTAVLIVHHRDDSCRVTPFGYAESFYERLTAPMKDLLDYSGGGSSGRECGPLNHHGFEGLESRVAIDISKWILELAGHP